MRPFATISYVRIFLGLWSPAVLLALWILVSSDASWPERIVTAAVFGLFMQTFGMLAYFMAVGIAAKLAGQDHEPAFEKIDIAGPHLIGALLLVVTVYVAGQHWRNEARSSVERCVREETGTTAGFGQFDNARELVDYCIHRYGDDYSSYDE